MRFREALRFWAVVGVLLNLAVFFGARVLLPAGHLGLFALLLALASFIALLRLRVAIPSLVPAGALPGMLWRRRG